MDNNVTALFFVGSHNEVDQISPVIYKLAERGKLAVDVVLQTRVSRDDYRVNFLDSYDTVRICSRKASTNSVTSVIRSFKNLIKSAGRKTPTQIPEKVYRFYKHRGGEKNSEDLTTPAEFSDRSHTVVGFDWGHAGSDETFHARDDVQSVVLPHGDSPYVNHQTESRGFFYRFLDDLRESEGVLTWSEIPQQNGYYRFLNQDYLLFPNERTASRVSGKNVGDQIQILGSPRYNSEWLDVLTDIRPLIDVPMGSLNVVIFARQDGYFVSKTELKHTIELLDAFPGVQTVVKEHPRELLLSPSVVNEMETVSIANNQIESVSLVPWGDVFLDMGTTISFEPIVRGKPVLELNYSHANRAVISEYFSNVDMQCKDDLFHAIRRFRKKGIDNFYSAKERQKFLGEMITSDNEAVLESYALLIEDAAGI